MRCLLALLATVVLGQNIKLDPQSPRQGEVIHVTAATAAASARMAGRTILLYAQPAGVRAGLMPVSYDAKPGQYTLEILSANGAVLDSVALTVRDAHYPIQNLKLSPSLESLKPSPGELETVAEFRRTITNDRYWQEPLQLPVGGCMTSPYGVQRYYNGKPTGNYHSGIDQRSAMAKPIRAIAGGVVRLERSYNLHGNVVGVDHGQGLSSIYLHMSKFAVKEGDVVKKGDILGYAGSTGRSTAPHLHWSLYANGVPVNPAQWVPLKSCYGARKRPAKRSAK